MIFGLVDSGLLIIFTYIGIDVDKHFNKHSSGVNGGLWGAAVGNAGTDLIAASIDPLMRAHALAIFIGCMIPIAFIPIVEKLRKRKAKKNEQNQ